MQFIDTNILIKKLKDKKFPIVVKHATLASVSGLEFLRTIDKTHNNRAAYHIPYKLGLKHSFQLSKLARTHDHAFRQEVTDRVIFDFANDQQSFALFNNEAITETINERNSGLFDASIASLSKHQVRNLRDRFSFLATNEMQCVSFQQRDIYTAYELLDAFLAKHTLKTDFRNSWNDLLILATVINRGGRIITDDKLLNKFAADYYGVAATKKSDYTEIVFPGVTVVDKNPMEKAESKAYINRGWNYKIRTGK